MIESPVPVLSSNFSEQGHSPEEQLELLNKSYYSDGVIDFETYTKRREKLEEEIKAKRKKTPIHTSSSSVAQNALDDDDLAELRYHEREKKLNPFLTSHPRHEIIELSCDLQTTPRQLPAVLQSLIEERERAARVFSNKFNVPTHYDTELARENPHKALWQEWEILDITPKVELLKLFVSNEALTPGLTDLKNSVENIRAELSNKFARAPLSDWLAYMDALDRAIGYLGEQAPYSQTQAHSETFQVAA